MNHRAALAAASPGSAPGGDGLDAVRTALDLLIDFSMTNNLAETDDHLDFESNIQFQLRQGVFETESQFLSTLMKS